MKVELGDEVQDVVTDYKGIVVAITEWLNGCRRICIQAKVRKGTKPSDGFTFDEPQIKILKKQKVKLPRANPKTEERTGGPIPDVVFSRN